MNQDAERWIKLQGPPPEGIRQLLEAARGPKPPTAWTPELAAELERGVYAMVAAEDAKLARRRKVKLGLAVGAGLAVSVGALALVLRATAGGSLGEITVPNAISLDPTQLGSSVGAAASGLLASPASSAAATAGPSGSVTPVTPPPPRR